MDKLTLVNVWYRGRQTCIMVVGHFDPKSGQTTVPAGAVEEAAKLAGVPIGTTYSIGL